MNRAFWYNQLLLESFDKAKGEFGNYSFTQLSQYLSDYIQNTTRKAYSAKSLRGHINKVREDSNAEIPFQTFVADGLSQYLEFTDFEAYLDSKPKAKDRRKVFPIKLWQLVTLGLAVALLIMYVIYVSINKQRWMVWEENHYVEVAFDDDLLKKGVLKLYKEDRIENFQKVTPTCDATSFFDQEGQVMIWYGKNLDKEYEYFTDLGLHPETGKTLKPITKYMIDKHVCGITPSKD